MQRARILRLTGLAGTAVLALAVPLAAATAGPADSLLPPGAPEPTGSPGARAAAGPLTDLGLPLLPGPARTTHCGPELTARERITAQTCVLTEGGRTWARTFFRNSSGDPLRAALTLLRPDGRSVQADCVVPAGGAPGVCETPGGPTLRGARLPYGAVAEFSDAAGERLLLRSSGNWAPDGGSSGH
ncbi:MULTISPECIES: hypothetical protein [unclassified Streptomyces]|uniref:hypothetical protein n=1 Tax=unclassified Streptomyces TaxID=2593676 RepID=UPI00037DF9A8|nr:MULTISPECIES: hypothetical protein [unclassified Streptomyces]MYT32348.1 hypothetical protein [Streptomyces sp. SID8354]